VPLSGLDVLLLVVGLVLLVAIAVILRGTRRSA
jgi:FlaG/FlaF family flagellin (archaellin)